jgi:hypothetical protein
MKAAWLICRLTGYHWPRTGMWFQTPHGWQRNRNCRFCSYHEYDQVIGWERPVDVWSGRPVPYR